MSSIKQSRNFRKYDATPSRRRLVGGIGGPLGDRYAEFVRIAS